MQIVVDDLIASYTRLGSGKATILCLHGWGDSSATFRQMTEQLPDYDVVLLDLPGFGGSSEPQKPWTLDDYSEFIAHFIQKLGLNIEVIIAHSNGGAIAIRGLSLGHIRAHKLILIASSGIRPPRSLRMKSVKLLAKSGRVGAKFLPASTQKSLKLKFYKKIGSDYLVAEHMQDTFKKVVSQDVLADANAIKIPAILIYGENDEATPVAYGELFHDAIQNSELHIVKDVGHFVHLDKSAEVHKIINKFLA